MARKKYLYKKDADRLNMSRFPSFHVTGSIKGMKDKFYGKDALLVQSGEWIYNVKEEEYIYYNIAH